MCVRVCGLAGLYIVSGIVRGVRESPILPTTTSTNNNNYYYDYYDYYYNCGGSSSTTRS